MEKIEIKSKLYDYSVEFVDNIKSAIDTVVGDVAFVIDKNVFELYQGVFSNLDKDRVYLLDAIEKNKNVDTVMDVIDFWMRIGVKKNCKICCFGGGITQDITTMACNLFLRNIDWYFFPTTFLAMCDSCIGGKCGINYAHYKNQLGVFYPPKKVFIDVSFLDTLSYGDYLNGWGEILKFSLTKEPEFYESLKNVDNYIPCECVADFIYKGLMVKKEIIEEDEFESDIRRILNYGHTFGHALEAYSDNAIPHGKGVIWGIDVVNYISYKFRLINEELYNDIKSFIKKEFLKEEVIIEEPDKLFDIIYTDKKVKGNTLSFALLNGDSSLVVYPVAIDDALRDIFYEYLETTHEYYCN